MSQSNQPPPCSAISLYMLYVGRVVDASDRRYRRGLGGDPLDLEVAVLQDLLGDYQPPLVLGVVAGFVLDEERMVVDRKWTHAHQFSKESRNERNCSCYRIRRAQLKLCVHT